MNENLNATLNHLLDEGYDIQTRNIILLNQKGKEVYLEGKVMVDGNSKKVEGVGKGLKYEDALSTAMYNLKNNVQKTALPVKKLVKALGELK